jgi:dipeptidase E
LGATRLLLLSNSTVFGRGYLDHAEAEIRDVLAGIDRVLFVPYALLDRQGYARQARARFDTMDIRLDSVAEAPDPGEAVGRAGAIFIGGGNTFRLVDSLHRQKLIDAIHDRVASGVPYIGSSAGSIVACPTLQTTKDMPIVQPPSFRALGLTTFQISPHYLDPDPASTHMGETQEERIRQFHEEQETPVVGLREGAMLRVEAGSVVLKGEPGARIFRRGLEPVEATAGQRIDEYLTRGARA